jgi:hypothetical protein
MVDVADSGRSGTEVDGESLDGFRTSATRKEGKDEVACYKVPEYSRKHVEGLISDSMAFRGG